MRIGSLFSGIGCLDLAIEAVTGGEVIWQSEIDHYAAHVLARRFPGVPNLGDIKEITTPPAVDALCGGFPCQDVSYAGKGEGVIEGNRSGLWLEYERLIETLRPKVVFVENVAGLRTRGLDRVLQGLARCGFDAEWGHLTAAAVGAPHRRKRIFVLAYSGDGALRELEQRCAVIKAERFATVARNDGLAVADSHCERRGERAADVSTRQPDAARQGLAVADTEHARRERQRERDDDGGRDASWLDPHGRDEEVRFPPGPDELARWQRWARCCRPMPGVRRAAYGAPDGLDARRRRRRLRGLGNGVVPRQAVAAFLMLLERALAGRRAAS